MATLEVGGFESDSTPVPIQHPPTDLEIDRSLGLFEPGEKEGDRTRVSEDELIGRMADQLSRLLVWITATDGTKRGPVTMFCRLLAFLIVMRPDLLPDAKANAMAQQAGVSPEALHYHIATFKAEFHIRREGRNWTDSEGAHQKMSKARSEYWARRHQNQHEQPTSDPMDPTQGHHDAPASEVCAG
jgi:hypothetical protein